VRYFPHHRRGAVPEDSRISQASILERTDLGLPLGVSGLTGLPRWKSPRSFGIPELGPEPEREREKPELEFDDMGETGSEVDMASRKGPSS